MKRILLTAFAFAWLSGTAYAGDAASVLVGNTLTVTSPAGTTKLWYKADNTYTGTMPNGATMSGSWSVEGGQLCTMQKSPAPPAGMEKNCGAFGDHKVGDSWESKGPGGEKLSLALTAGS